MVIARQNLMTLLKVRGRLLRTGSFKMTEREREERIEDLEKVLDFWVKLCCLLSP